MTAPRIWVFYEDSRGPQREFAPHVLLLACVGDQFDRDPWSLRPLIEPIPKNSVTKLITACAEDVGDLCGADASVVAIIDSDRVREHTRPPLLPAAHDDEVLENLSKTTDHHPRFYPMLLDRNLETLLRAIAHCDTSLESSTRSAAIRKDHSVRDRLCMRAARPDSKLVRDCILRSMPSFHAIVAQVACLVAPELGFALGEVR